MTIEGMTVADAEVETNQPIDAYEDQYDDSDDVVTDSDSEEAPVETAKKEEPETEVEVRPEPEDVPVPDWMRSVLQPPQPPPQQQPITTSQEQLVDLRDTIFDEDTQQLLNRMVDQKVNAVRSETAKIAQQLLAQKRKEAQMEVGETLSHVHKHLYNDIFRNDSTFQGNKEAAEFLDSTVRNFIENASIEAVELGNYESLRMARDPRFGKVVAAMVKAMKGIPDGKTPAIKIKGAQVEASTPTAAKSSSYKISPEVRAELKRYGISEAQHLKDMEFTGSNFSDYDND